MSEASKVQILVDPVQQTTCPKCRCTMETAGLEAFSPIICPQCGQEMQVSARLGNFLLVRLIGAGGMGGVYWARDRVLNRDVAIKVMLKSLGDDRKFIETFLREAQAAARINHPNIAQIYSFGQEKGQPYIVMELVTGGGLDKLMEVTPQMDQAVVMRIGLEMAEALKQASESGLVHGDIKPENILIGEGGISKLVDFGIASMSGSSKSAEIWGTPYYIAPEKVKRKKADFRSDMYSLGGTLYHALAGVPPFDGPDAVTVVKARFISPPTPLIELRKDIDPDVVDVVMRMLALEPARRHPTYDSLISDMRRYVDRAGPIQLIGAASKKIVLKRKDGTKVTSKLTDKMSTTGNLSVAVPSKSATRKGMVLQRGAIHDRNVPTDDDIASAQAAEERAHKRTKITLMTVTLLVLGLVFGMIGLYWAKTVKYKSKLAEISATAEARQQIFTNVRNAFADTQKSVSIIDANINDGKALVEQAVRIASAELEKAWHLALVPLKPAKPTEDSADTNATNVVVAPVTAAIVDTANYPLLVNEVRALHFNFYALQDCLPALSEAQDRLRTEAAAFEKSTNTVDVLREEAKEYIQRCANFKDDKVFKNAKELLVKLEKGLEGIRDTITNSKAERERLAEEQKKLEQERLVQAEAERALAERQAAVERELGLVKSLDEENLPLLKKFEFKKAVRSCTSLARDLKTEEGQAALELVREKADRLSELHAFLVSKVTGFRSSEGWSILAANERAITITGNKEIPWSDIGNIRLALLIKSYLVDDHNARELKLLERVRQTINGALYCDLFVKESPQVQDMAEKMVTYCVEKLPTSKEDIRRLLPDKIKD